MEEKETHRDVKRHRERERERERGNEERERMRDQLVNMYAELQLCT